MPNWMDAGNEEFKKLVQTIIDANFTHAHIAGIISDLVDLYPDGYGIEDFSSSVNKRIQSIANAAMVTGSDGHIVEAKK
jgi:hypothetical protein